MTMFETIEVVDFYFIEYDPIKKQMCGTLHVYFPDLDLDLRGVWVGRTFKNGWSLRLPSRKGMDTETKQEVVYPIISFSNRETQKKLEKDILNASKELILEKLKTAKPMKPLHKKEKAPFEKKKLPFEKRKTDFSKMPPNTFVSVIR